MLRNHSYIIRTSLMFFIILTILTLFTSKTMSSSSKDNILNEKPIAVMIGNSTEEREIQKGLNKADVIYEIEVEFPFTRLMALYLEDINTVVGPVRSSRYYFSRICAEWTAAFVHCGGQRLKNSKVIDFDELQYQSLYWRDDRIGGWINLFTNIHKISQEINKYNNFFNNKNENSSSYNLLSFKALNSNNSNNINKITIKYNPEYIVNYEYDKNNNIYYRYVNQKPHIDHANGEQISLSNIVIQHTDVNEIKNDEKGRVDVKLVGEGIAQVFNSGEYQLAKWVKNNKERQTIFLDKKGFPVTNSCGNTWIHILSQKSKIWFK